MSTTRPPLGVLLSNLGTPDAPTPAAVRRYLREFLWDPRVVEAPRLAWWLVLNGIILRTRPRKSAAAYAAIWGEDGSPLLSISRAQAARVQTALSERLAVPVRVALAMRYGTPSIAQGLAELEAAGAERVLVLPLYPQYSATTAASTFDACAKVLSSWREQPSLRFVRDYHDDPGYLDALAASVRAHWAEHGRGDKLVLSFHGIPKTYAEAGDPYPQQCQRTAEQLAARLELAPTQWVQTFQSRFGPREWLQPYTDQTLQALARDGVKRVDLICPGFAADCLETLEENAIGNCELYLQAGGERFEYIPCLNTREGHIEALAALIERNLGGWL